MWRALLLALMLLPSQALGSIVITEVMCNPAGSDTLGEWVKITNTGSSDVDITGWRFNDGSNHNLNVPPENGGTGSMLMAPGSAAYLARDASEVSLLGTVIDTAMALNNTADELAIVDGSGGTVSTYSYTSSDGFADDQLCVGTTTNSTGDSAADSAADTTIESSAVITTVNTVTKYRTVEVQPPQALHVRAIADKVALVGSIVEVHVEVYDATGKAGSPQCRVAFGDGSEGLACSSNHLYQFSGTYVVSIHVQQESLVDNTKFTVTVSDPGLAIAVGEDSKYVEIANSSDTDAELNGWSIRVGHKSFKIPSGTTVPASSSIKISASTMHIDIARYGSIAQLLNALGKVVADSSVLQLVPTKDEEVVAITPAASSIVANPPVTISKAVLVIQESTPTVSSIVGTPLPSMHIATPAQEPLEQSVSAPEAVLEPVVNVPQVASAAASGVVPSSSGKWLVGLFALLGLAALPLWLGK